MIKATTWLTMVTLLGMVSGFVREWLLVAQWGATGRTDAFLVAIFLPEALRTILAAGVITSSALSLWQARDGAERARWFSQLGTALTLGAVLLSAGVSALASPWMALTGPGLESARIQAAAPALQIMAWTFPAFILQAWWALPRHATGRFTLVGVGSLLYNLPAILVIVLSGEALSERGLAGGFLLGSALMALVLWPGARRRGFRFSSVRGVGASLGEWGRLIGPLMLSAMTGQGIVLVERVLASGLGEGVVTAINLARKLVSLPLMALQSLNQVMLSLMARKTESRRTILEGGLRAVTLLSLPASVALIAGAPFFIATLFPRAAGVDLVAHLLTGYAGLVVFAGWASLLARFHYAEGDTRTPVRAEILGGLLQALCLPPLVWALGPMGLVWGGLVGIGVTSVLLLRHPDLRGGLGLWPQTAMTLLTLAVTAWWLPRWLSTDRGWMLAEVATVACLVLLAQGLLFSPWRVRPTPSPTDSSLR